MNHENNKSLPWRSFLSFPYLEDDFWGVENERSSGLSLSEDDTHVYVEAHLPGLREEDIDISIDKGVLSIRGSKKEEQKDEKKRYYRKASSSFSYSVNIPSHADFNKEPEATYKDGVIKVAFLKSQKDSSAKKISIKK